MPKLGYLINNYMDHKSISISLTEQQHNALIDEVSKVMMCFKEQCKLMGNNNVFICPLEEDKFMWLINNLENGKVGVTSICPSTKNEAQFACLCIDTKRALYYEAEGFTIDDMVKDNIIQLVPCKSIMSTLL